MGRLRVDFLRDFQDPRVPPAKWNSLALATGTIFQTHEFLSAWWATLGRGQSLLAALSEDDDLLTLAPLFFDSGMVFPIGVGSSDYLDLLGSRTAEHVQLLVQAMIERLPDLIGFRFYHLPEDSPTRFALVEVSQNLGWSLFEEGSQVAPFIDLEKRETIETLVHKKSLLRRENHFRRRGTLRVVHASRPDSVLPHLDSFFEQHVQRWKDTGSPSLFSEGRQRRFYWHLTQQLGHSGWLRFTRLSWNGEPIAFHFGLLFGESFLWYKPSFELRLSRWSPGQVLLRQLFQWVGRQDVKKFDFGLGDETFKFRFANRQSLVHDWGLYRPGAVTT